MSRIAVMLMDDHAVVREGLRALLERTGDIEVVAEAASVAEAVRTDETVHVIVADLVLPDGRGADVVRRLGEAHPDAAIVVLSMVDDLTEVQICLAAGAHGYLLKATASAELVAAIRRVAAGEEYMQPALGARLARWREAPTRPRSPAASSLTPREVEVMHLIAAGHTNAEAAKMLFVSVRTVENHRASVMRKLGVHKSSNLVRIAIRDGLVAP